MAAPVRLGHLDRMVHEIAADDRIRVARAKAHTRVPRRVTRRGLQPDLVADPMVHLDQRREPGVQHRRDAVVHDPRGVLVALARPVLPLAPREQVTRARKRRNPASVVEPRVPPDVVDVQMRADHHVHRLRRHARYAQVVQERRPHHVERLPPAAILVVADARVDEHGQSRRAHDEGVDRLQEPALVVEEMRREPGAMAFHRLGRRVREQPRWPRRSGALDDRVDAQTAEAERAHHGRSRARMRSIASSVCSRDPNAVRRK